MSLTPPLDFTDLDDAPSGEIGLLVERAAAEADAATLEEATALLLDRALRLLREGSRQEIQEEALAVSRGVAGGPGRALRERSPVTFGAWTALVELLAEAGRRNDRAAVPSLLRSTQGHGLAILELLAAEGRAVPRAEIRRRLNLGEAHLSHLLRDLESADLILRYRPERSKEVLVELGPAGREVVSQSVLPPWVERLRAAADSGSPIDGETLARELQEAGAPSRLMAVQLAAIVAERSGPALPDAVPPPADEPPSGRILHFEEFKKRVARLQEDGISRYEEMQVAEASLSAQRALFGTRET